MNWGGGKWEGGWRGDGFGGRYWASGYVDRGGGGRGVRLTELTVLTIENDEGREEEVLQG